MLSDLRLALRSLAKAPAYTAVVVFTLTLGIGANTAIFSFFNGILLRPLPFRQAEEILVLKKSPEDYNDPVGSEVGLYAADYAELQSQLRNLTDLATFTLDSATVTGRGSASLVSAAVVTPNFFATLGSQAVLGRAFQPADVAPGGPRLATLSHEYWQSHFGGSFDVVGQTITANRVPFTIVGVMPSDFDFPREAQLWVTPAAGVPENAIGQDALNFSGRGTNFAYDPWSPGPRRDGRPSGNRTAHRPRPAAQSQPRPARGFSRQPPRSHPRRGASRARGPARLRRPRPPYRLP
jgi:putative ABC transport system permease protein